MDANRRGCLIALLFATASAGQSAAEAHFLQGLRSLHSFEYDDARDEFAKCRKQDPTFVMAYWGEAVSYTEPIWGAQDVVNGRAALARLAPTSRQRLAAARTDRERDYLSAAEALYGAGDYRTRTLAYQEAMRHVSAKHPGDLDAAALYALSILGTAHGGRDYATYMRAAAVAEEVYSKDPNHPGALHYLIHCYDDPVHAPLGLRAARRYASVAPEAAHALHMPSHIFVAMGMWDEVIASNEASWNASVARVQAKKLPIEDRSYHALYWLEYAYLQQGRYREAANLLKMVQSDAQTSGAAYVRYHLALMSAAYVLETGDHAKLPVDLLVKDLDSPAAGAYLFASGYSALQRGDKKFARQMAAAIRSLPRITSDHREHSDTTGERSTEIMALQLEGLLLGIAGSSLLEQAAQIEDKVPFQFGPPLPVKPAHELLGDMLLSAGKYRESRSQFMRALARTPGKVSALRGLARAALKSGDTEAARAIYSDIRHIRRKADVQWDDSR
jgi:tetratricopeptide (TPR) repeat protein